MGGMEGEPCVTGREGLQGSERVGESGGPEGGKRPRGAKPTNSEGEVMHWDARKGPLRVIPQPWAQGSARAVVTCQ